MVEQSPVEDLVKSRICAMVVKCVNSIGLVECDSTFENRIFQVVPGRSDKTYEISRGLKGERENKSGTMKISARGRRAKIAEVGEVIPARHVDFVMVHEAERSQ